MSSVDIPRKGYSRKAVNKVVFAKYPDLEQEKAVSRLKLAFRVGPKSILDSLLSSLTLYVLNCVCFSLVWPRVSWSTPPGGEASLRG